ncbi:MAG TPA: hypothetical protein VHV52_14455 [Gaiellaceae bacterium]|jgi:hypothetical protein|nr:hypothetical protein [Gaiellaceae bacterium]
MPLRHRFGGLQLAALAAALLTALIAFAAPPRAQAAAGIKYGLSDDAWLLDGAGTPAARVATLQKLGVKIVRFTLHWNQIAPTAPATPTDPADPAYDWTQDSDVLDALHAARVDVVLQLVGTPSWANGGKGANWAPTTSAPFGAFATAAAREYPWVKKWLIWNEPNQIIWLRPTLPTIYVTRLLNPAYAAIHKTIAGAQVAGGGTAPRGATDGVSPVAWLTGMFKAHARLDAYAHNPYPLDPKHETPTTGGCTNKNCTTITMATLSRLETLVAKDFPHARIWLTEYGYQSDPPDTILGVSLALQARYLALGAWVAYHAPRVDMLIHFLYRDEPNISRFQSGLLTVTNKIKPAYYAFELPLAEIARSGTRTTLWGQFRAPAAGSVGTIQRRVGSAWRTVATVRRGAGGFFTWKGVLPKGAAVRIHTGTITGAAFTIT